MVLTQLVCPASLKFNWEKFPSHYGSHSTGINKYNRDNFDSFHPTMVLTQHGSGACSDHGSHGFHPTMVLTQPSPAALELFQQVSIPLWFSLNKLKVVL